MIEIALEGLLVVLLLLTITWCVIVHYRLRRLRTDRGELESFIAALAEATTRAEDVVRQMREANTAIEGTTREQERRARHQGAELARLMDNAVRVLKRLDAAVEHGATRVAELRTAETATPRPEAAPLATAAASPKRATRQPPPTERAAAGEPMRAPKPETGPDRPVRTMRPARREGQLDGLLHGDLRHALEGLR
jgi:type II secretory pathway component PulM